MFRFGDPGGRVYGAVGTANANLISYWTSYTISGSATVAVSASNGRTTGSSLRHTGGNILSYVAKVLDSQATWGVAFALRVSFLPPITIVIAGCTDAGTNQCDLRLNTDGSLTVTRNGTTLGTTASLISTAYVHIEFKVTIHPSAGTVDVWVNGISRLSLTSQNTRNSANSSANTVFLGVATSAGAGASSNNWDYDDIIVYDGQTTDAAGNPDITGPIGDCGLAWLLPTAAGSNTQFTPDSGSNYARVQDTTIDTTSYVESSTVNNIDSYNIADLPTGASVVKSTAVVSYVRKTDTGSRGARNLVRTASTNYPHINEIALSDSYLYYFQGWGSNPNTGLAWIPSDINGLEIGQKVTT